MSTPLKNLDIDFFDTEIKKVEQFSKNIQKMNERKKSYFKKDKNCNNKIHLNYFLNIISLFTIVNEQRLQSLSQLSMYQLSRKALIYNILFINLF